MPILILLIILDLAIIGWVLYVGVRDSAAISQSAHTVPDVKSPEVQARVEPAAASAPPVDTRFIRAERGEERLPDTETDLNQSGSSESVVQIRPPKSEEGGENA